MQGTTYLSSSALSCRLAARSRSLPYVRNLSRNLALAHGARARLLERITGLLDPSVHLLYIGALVVQLSRTALELAYSSGLLAYSAPPVHLLYIGYSASVPFSFFSLHVCHLPARHLCTYRVPYQQYSLARVDST